jgi:MGT family glycosyltransferase
VAATHLLFVSPPTVGHVNPILGVVEELLARGHRVTYVTGPATSAIVRSTGAAALELPLRVHDARHGSAGFSTADLAGTLNRLVDDTRSVAPELFRLVADDPPDVVCHDALSFVGSSLAERFRVPDVVLVPHLAENEHVSLAVRMAPHGFDLTEPAMAAFAGNMISLATDLAAESRAGTKPEPSGQRLTLVFVPRHFQIDGETFADHVRFVGPTLPSASAAVDWSPGSTEKPLLYIALGTIMNDRPDFFRLCVDAFTDGPWQVAMAVGDLTDTDLFATVPSNFDIRPYFPQPAVLRHAQAFVSHAGMNSVMEAASARVPMLAVPQTPEGAVNAHRVQELALGRVADPDSLTAAVLRDLVEDTARDLRIRRGLSAMAGHLRAAGGARAAADAIEELVVDTEHATAGRSERA